MYDIIIWGGQIIDPSQNINAKMDLAVKDGKIAAIGKDLTDTDSKQLINAKERIVIPGLIDLHTHVYEGVSHYGINADKYCLKNGVTTCLDVGSAGADTFNGFRKYIISKSQTRILALLNLSAIGMVSERAGELENLQYADVDYAVKIILENRGTIVGLKVRMEKNFLAGNAKKVLELVRKAAEEASCLIMFHIGDTSPSLPSVLEAARPGDIITHIYHSRREGILDSNGKVIPEAFDAASRGVYFDVGHGRGSFSYDICRKALDQGFEPHTISSDLHIYNINSTVYDLTTTMSKFLYLGMSLYDIVEKCTDNPASVLDKRKYLGTLKVGACADIAILKLESKDIELTDAGWDQPQVTVKADEYLTTTKLVRGGKIVL